MKRIVLAALVCALGLSAPVRAQGPRTAIHGADSVFATAEVVMVWAVLRAGAGDDAEVVIRLVAPRFAALSVEAVDPFGGGRRLVVPRQPLSGATEVRRRRADFAEFPRLEVHLHPAPDAAAPGPITIYYLGVPDTTPEFVSEAALRRYVEDAVAKARGSR